MTTLADIQTDSILGVDVTIGAMATALATASFRLALRACVILAAAAQQLVCLKKTNKIASPLHRFTASAFVWFASLLGRGNPTSLSSRYSLFTPPNANISGNRQHKRKTRHNWLGRCPLDVIIGQLPPPGNL